MQDDINHQKLDFIVIGAQKCATSWLYYCLQDHPQLCVPAKKFEAGYIGGDVFAKDGASAFFDRFSPDANQKLGDVSVEYLYDHTTPAALSPFVSDPQLIASLREPVARMISGYYWLLRRGVLPNAPFEQTIAPVLDQKPGFPDKIDGPLEEVVRRGCYGPQIRGFTDMYGLGNLFVMLYEDVDERPLESVRSVYEFLGVDAAFSPPSINVQPKKNSYSSFLLGLENATRSRVLIKILDYANRTVSRFTSPKDVASRAVRQKLAALYAPAIEETFDLLGQVPRDQCPSPDHLRRQWGL